MKWASQYDDVLNTINEQISTDCKNHWILPLFETLEQKYKHYAHFGSA